MRKALLIVAALVCGFFVFAQDKKEDKQIPTCYSIRCYKCDEYNAKYRGYGNAGGIAERRFEAEAKSGLKHTFIYKCHYGHVLCIDTETGERK